MFSRSIQSMGWKLFDTAQRRGTERKANALSEQELTSDGHIFLNIDRSYVAWAAYRSTLISPPKIEEPSGRFVSWWLADLLRDSPLLGRELALERVRAHQFSERISRLNGIFCFLDKVCADEAVHWGGHFKAENRVDINLGAAKGRDRLDANWITHADPSVVSPSDEWIPLYWQGEPYPYAEPVWETIVEGKVTVLGTEVRKRANEVVRACWPDSLMFLEISRAGAWISSDIGSISVFMEDRAEDYRFRYKMDMRDANDADFLARLTQLRESGHPVNWTDIAPHYEVGNFGCVPDMTPYHFSCPKNRLKSRQL